MANNLGEFIYGTPSASLDTLGTQRDGLASIFNSRAIALEDYMRSEKSADNQLLRDMQLQAQANEFNAQQAQIDRDFQERMANTQYQRAIEDMKKAGINPIMLMGSQGADVPTGAQASASGARSGGSNYQNPSRNSGGLGLLAQIVSGLITKGKSSGSTLSQTFNKNGELVRSVINTKK